MQTSIRNGPSFESLNRGLPQPKMSIANPSSSAASLGSFIITTAAEIPSFLQRMRCEKRIVSLAAEENIYHKNGPASIQLSIEGSTPM